MDDLPLGFGMALAQHPEAMARFAALSEAEQQASIDGAHAVRDFTEFFEVNGAGIGRGSGHDHLRPALLSQIVDRIIIQHLRLIIQAVRHNVKVLAGDVHRAAV